MTNEEAKSFLINISYQLGNMGVEYLSEKDGEKMREAIKAIEQTELNPSYNGVKSELKPCEDCVSREDAVNALRKALYNYEDKTEKQFKESKELNLEDWFQHRIFVQNMNDIDIQTILELPSVIPQQKKGKWIEKEYMDTGLSEIWCSNCKDSNFYNQTDNPFIPTNYCPNCGADMRGDADETDN